MLRNSIIIASLLAAHVADAAPKYVEQLDTLQEVRETGDLPTNAGGYCREELDYASKHGNTLPDVLTDPRLEHVQKSYKDKDGFHLKAADVDEICKALEKLQPVGDATHTISAAASFGPGSVKSLRDNSADSGSGVVVENYARYAKVVAECRPAIATLQAAGIKSIGVKIIGQAKLRTTAVADIEANICVPNEKEVVEYKKFLDEIIKSDKEWAEREAAPYKKVGISGDKLSFLVGMSGRAVYASGGKEITTPAQKKAASVMFEVLTGGDGSVTIKRFAFKGMKAAGESQRDYPRRPGGSAFK